MSDNNDATLEERAKSVEKAADAINKFKVTKKIQFSHLIGERNFDIKVSKIEESILKDINESHKLKAFKKINDKIRDIFRS